MRVVAQRVTEAAVEVDGAVVGRIGRGLLALVGVGHHDTAAGARSLAVKLANLRLFEDTAGKTNLALKDVGGAVLVVSQFTLYADTRKGRRPSFTSAADPALAEELVEEFRSTLADLGLPTAQGSFGAHMRVSLTNDGPFTLLLEDEGEG